MIRMSRSVSIFSLVVVMTVTVLATVAVAFAQEDPLEEPENEGGGGPVGKVSVCHNTEHNPHIITVGEPAVAAHLAHGDSTEGACGDVPLAPGTPEPPDGTTLVLTTLATTDVTLGSPISDTATLSGATSDATGTITFTLYGPYDASVDPATEQSDPCAAGEVVDTSDPIDIGPADAQGNYVVESPEFEPTVVGRYQWIASYSGDDKNEASTTLCRDAGEASVVNEASSTTGTEQNMTLAGEIGEDANLADPATDTTNIEGTTQNGNTTLGTDSEDDVLYGNASANKLLGRHGNDYLDGGKGRDRLVGGKQADRINGADGKPGDVINGGIGIDYCVGDVGDEIKNCDGNVVNVPLPSEAAAPAEARN
jgi:RTX calcium-binding nonapeptide repeat (4 copies)